VDEQEWLTATDPNAMLELLRDDGRADGRKLRLFGCACVRLVCSRLEEEPPEVVQTAEDYADGAATKAALRRDRRQVREERYVLDAAAEVETGPVWGAYWLSELAASENAYGSVAAQMSELSPHTLPLEAPDWVCVCAVLRDIFANPFRPLPPLAAPVLAWHGGVVKRLAGEAYRKRIMPEGTLDPQRLAILADALEEAGADAGLEAHLRDPGPHWRGCWGVDLLLAKE
jgi:hypothetical protein